MSKNYDNWERLVEAVLRRENDERIALCDSMESSIFSPSSSSSSLDYQETTGIPNCLSGKKVYMIGARELVISWGNTPDYWQWTSHADSRFSEVAQLKSVCWLDIRGKIKTQMLSLNTTYGAYLVFKFAEKSYGLVKANTVVRFVKNESDKYAERRAVVVQLQGVTRADGWMEIEMGSFYNSKKDKGEVEARLMEIKRLDGKSGLIVEGIEFRPKSLSFFREKKSGKMGCMIGARELEISWGDTPDYWKWTSHADSRFSEVAQLKSVYWLDIRGKIKTQMLSLKTTYGVYLVFKFAEEFYGLEKANAVVRFVKNESDEYAERRAVVVQLQGARRADGWMEIEVGSFYNSKENDGEVEARLMEIKRLNWKSGLIVEGIEFRPKK